MDERRRHKREYLIFYLRVFDLNSSKLLGHIVDITVEGIRLISEEPLSAEQEFNLKMDLPDEINGVKQIFFRAKALHSKKDVNPSFYVTGCSLMNMSDENKEIIKQLIDDFKFGQSF